jgi:hypothetical protein
MQSFQLRRYVMRAICLGIASAVAASAVAAPLQLAPDQPVAVVAVPGAAPERDEKSYRDLLSAIAVFEKHAGMAPGASLRFKVHPRQAGVSMDGLVLQIVGEHTRIQVPLAPDHSFVLPRSAEAARDNATVRFNREPKSLAWRADIRSPGVPANARRLGDLMLECRVALAGDLVAYPHHPINLIVVKLMDPCRDVPINLVSFADRPVFSVTLLAGARRSVMPAAMLHGPALVPLPGQEDWLALRERAYMVKYKALYDKNWPDDTLLLFDYMDDDTPLSPPPAQAAADLQ